MFAGESPDLTFVEVEDEHGRSARVGRWVDRIDGGKALELDLADDVRHASTADLVRELGASKLPDAPDSSFDAGFGELRNSLRNSDSSFFGLEGGSKLPRREFGLLALLARRAGWSVVVVEDPRAVGDPWWIAVESPAGRLWWPIQESDLHHVLADVPCVLLEFDYDPRRQARILEELVRAAQAGGNQQSP